MNSILLLHSLNLIHMDSKLLTANFSPLTNTLIINSLLTVVHLLIHSHVSLILMSHSIFKKIKFISNYTSTAIHQIIIHYQYKIIILIPSLSMVSNIYTLIPVCSLSQVINNIHHKLNYNKLRKAIILSSPIKINLLMYKITQKLIQL